MKNDLLSEANARDEGVSVEWDGDNQQWWNWYMASADNGISVVSDPPSEGSPRPAGEVALPTLGELEAELGRRILVGTNDGGIHNGASRVDLDLKRLEHLVPDTAFGPIVEAVIHRFPRAKAFGKIAPRMPVRARYSTASTNTRSPSSDAGPGRARGNTNTLEPLTHAPVALSSAAPSLRNESSRKSVSSRDDGVIVLPRLEEEWIRTIRKTTIQSTNCRSWIRVLTLSALGGN